MDGFHKRKKRFKFTEKKHSKRGIAAVVVAVALIVMFIVYLALAFKAKGTLSIYFGCFGVLAMCLSVFNLFPVVKGMREENSFQLFPRLGLILTLVAMTLWIGIYVHGFRA